MFNTGSAIGAVVAPPLIALIVSTLGWRSVFDITGGAGFVWAAIWLTLYRPPATNRFLSPEERESLLGSSEVRQVTSTSPPVRRIPWFQLFTYREVLGLMTAKFLTESAWYFFLFWLPKYLGDERYLNIQQIGAFAWIPYAFAGAGSLSGACWEVGCCVAGPP